MNRTKWVIDRIEKGETEDMAVLEDTEFLRTVVCPVSGLPRGIREGDVLLQDGPFFMLDVEETTARSRKIRERFERLKKKP